MKLNDYQEQAKTTELMVRKAVLSANDPALVAKVLGLVGEAGEVAEKYKKLVRDKGGEFTNEDKQEMIKELGDVLWYISAMADYLGFTLEQVAQANLDKLLSRKTRGTQHGSGDNR